MSDRSPRRTRPGTPASAAAAHSCPVPVLLMNQRDATASAPTSTTSPPRKSEAMAESATTVTVSPPRASTAARARPSSPGLDSAQTAGTWSARKQPSTTALREQVSTRRTSPLSRVATYRAAAWGARRACATRRSNAAGLLSSATAARFQSAPMDGCAAHTLTAASRTAAGPRPRAARKADSALLNSTVALEVRSSASICPTARVDFR